MTILDDVIFMES